MIRSTFRLAPGVGPHLEAKLWSDGVSSWDRFPAAPRVALSPLLDGRVREAIARAREALERGDAEALAGPLRHDEGAPRAVAPAGPRR